MGISVEDYEGNSKAFHAAAGSFFGGLVLTMLIDMFIHKLRNDSGAEDPHNLRIFDRPATTETDKPISADGVEGDADGVVSARSQSYRDGVTVQETSADVGADAVAVADDAGGSNNPFAADEK